MAKLNANQRKLLIIFALFFVPLLIAVTWYWLLPADYRPSGMTNNGQLLNPIEPIAPFEQNTKAGAVYSGKDLETKWTLVHLISGKCNEKCSKWLYNTRQIRIALAEDMDRVQRLAIVDAAVSARNNEKMWASHPDLQVIISAPGGVGEQIRQHAQAGSFAEHSVFLIDPLGNLIMHFPPDLEPKKLMKDLEKLLRLSQIG